VLSMAVSCNQEEGPVLHHIPPWNNPWAGHNLRPFHIFPFKVARKLKLLFFKRV
jgi:hypothetical protein